MKYKLNGLPQTRWAALGTVALAAAVLSACGGGGMTGTSVSGRVMDGYLTGAIVCHDVNANLACDAGETTATTTAGGRFELSVSDTATMGGANLLVEVPATAIDEDTNAAVGTAYRMRGVLGSTAVVSPLTTAMAAYMDAGSTRAAAAAAVLSDLGLGSSGIDVEADYVGAQDTSTHNVAKLLAKSFQNNPTQTQARLVASLGTLADVAGQAYASATALDSDGVNALIQTWEQQLALTAQPITFASGYTGLSDAELAAIGYAYQGTTPEGGAFSWTVADAGSYGWDGSTFWWHGVASDDATPNFYWGGAGLENQAYMESWVNAADNQTITLSGQSLLRIAVWGNDELVGAPRFTPVIQLADDGNGCYARAEASALTPAAAGVKTYDVALSDFTVMENCGVEMTTAEFMAKPIASVRVRIYKDNYYTSSGVFGQPNGINLGPITFEPTPAEPLAFASGYAGLSDAELAAIGYAYQGTTTEGGAFSWTVADAASYGWDGSTFWWHGVAASDATPNFYWGGAGLENQAYMESWVNAANNETVSLNGQSVLRLSVWGNDELVGAPRFTPVVQLANDGNGCYARAEAAPLTPAASGVASYDVALADFSVIENCGTAMTTAEFMAKPIASVRVRIYKDQYYTSGGAYGQPNGINLGPITFVD